MRKVLLVAAAAMAFLCSCDDRRPQAVEGTTNPDFRVQYMFTYDGCRVYSFEGWDGRDHYFVKCSDGEAETNDDMNCGKNCMRDDIIPTRKIH